MEKVQMIFFLLKKYHNQLTSLNISKDIKKMYTPIPLNTCNMLH